MYCYAKRVSGAERAVLPFRVKAYFCYLRLPLRSRSAIPRSALSSAPLTCSIVTISLFIDLALVTHCSISLYDIAL